MNEVIDYVYARCEYAGVRIVEEESDIWIGKCDAWQRIIYLHPKLDDRTRAFVLLHEFAHWLQYMDNSYVPKCRDSHEFDADTRAANLLLEFGCYREREEYSRLVEYYRGYRV